MRNKFHGLLGVAWLLASVFTPSNATALGINPTTIWANPDGKVDDFDTTLVYQRGDVVMLQWDGWPYETPINTTLDWVDMWLTGHGTSYATRLEGILTFPCENPSLC
jgi:hypothetical protein